MTGGGAVKTVHREPTVRLPAPAARAAAVIRSVATRKGLCVPSENYQTIYHRVPPDHPTSQSHRAHRLVLRFRSDTSASRSPCTFRRSFTVLGTARALLPRSGQVWCQPTTASYSWHAATDSCCGTANVHGAARKRSSARCVPTLCMHWAERRSTDGDDARETTHARERERRSG